jgi:2-C-methyl-D-erythritol 2,4-cyclodiphosphate synthase
MTQRIGFGYDIHRLVPDKPLFLGCVQIPYEKGLLGHSDGDAAAHAVADAILGAGGLGDLGVHFPPSDPQWAGVSGTRILEETRKKLIAQSYRLLHIDVTIVAEEPKIAAHREAMIRAMASALGCRPSVISVKGRTHDGLGEIGRGEAIAAYAVILLEEGS